MYGVHPRIGKLQLAIGQSVCIDETRKPSDCFPAFRTVLLNVLVSKQIETHTLANTKVATVLRIMMAHLESLYVDRQFEILKNHTGEQYEENENSHRNRSVRMNS